MNSTMFYLITKYNMQIIITQQNLSADCKTANVLVTT